MKTYVILLVLLLIGGVAIGLVAGIAGKPNATPTATPDPMIVVDAPVPGSTVSSPLIVSGRARGNWYFEASFPVTLKTTGGAVIAQAPAQAQGDWMTTDWVPFTVTLIFPSQPAGTAGVLVLEKDNPSGEPQFDDSRTLPIKF